MKKFFVTTPIYYSNGLPHIGHAYSTLLADLLARYKRLAGYEVKFSAGTDENSQKIVKKAKEEGRDVYEYLDELAKIRQDSWDDLDITYTDFIRTTAPEHKEFVQKILQKTHDAGDIYQDEYHGYYCEGCEAFIKKSELTDEGLCPDHLTPPKELHEKNRFFRLSNYEDKLLDYYEQHPDFCLPEFRFNELKRFVKDGLDDFSISRETNKFGIPLPFDADQVTYVWYDALLNYLTVCQRDDEKFRNKDTEIVHVMAKDITRFHVVYRPAMLMSIGYSLPDSNLVTGYLTLKEQKISKSLGNTIDPLERVERYDRDALLFYLFGDLTIGSDGSISEERLYHLYKAVLVGTWGNLVSRAVNLGVKFELTTTAAPPALGAEFIEMFDDNQLVGILLNKRSSAKLDDRYFNEYDLKGFFQDRLQVVSGLNELLQQKEPRKTYKDETTRQEAVELIQFTLYMIKNLGLVAAPLLTTSWSKLQTIFGNEQMQQIDTTQTVDQDLVSAVFDAKELPVDLQKEHVYSF